MNWRRWLGLAADILAFFVFLNSTETLDQLVARWWGGMVVETPPQAATFYPPAAIITTAILLILLAFVYFSICYKALATLSKTKVGSDGDLSQRFFIFGLMLLGALGAMFVIVTGPIGRLVDEELGGLAPVAWALMFFALCVCSSFTVIASVDAAKRTTGEH